MYRTILLCNLDLFHCDLIFPYMVENLRQKEPSRLENSNSVLFSFPKFLQVT